MKGNWTYADLIDLEYCLSTDRDADQRELHKRDRQIYLEFSEEVKNGDRAPLINHWLLERKNQLFAEQNSPGSAVVESYRTVSLIMILCGTIIGLATGLAFFSYSGTTPVNVLNFLFIFVFSQLLMLVFLALAAGLRMAGADIVPAPVASLYGAIVTAIFSHSKKLSALLPAQHTGALNRLQGILKQQKSIYGQVFYWPLFRLSQQTMTGLNLGLLAATFFRILTSDIAFGWQSTIQFSTSFIASVTRVLALPWSWLVPHPYAYPSPEQIEGSRIILKDGIYHLQTQDLVSWWPFLVLCILFYGVIVRLLLLLVSRACQWRAMHNLKFNRPILIQLAQRLTTPLMSSQAQQSTADESASTHLDPHLNDGRTDTVSSSSTLLLIPADIAENCDASVFRQYLQRRGFGISDQRIIQAGYDSDQSIFEHLSTYGWQEDDGLVIIMESWMPPIQETLAFIQQLRSAAGPQIPIFVGLVGHLSDQSVITNTTSVERRIWQQKLDALADPYLYLLDLGTEKNDDS